MQKRCAEISPRVNSIMIDHFKVRLRFLLTFCFTGVFGCTTELFTELPAFDLTDTGLVGNLLVTFALFLLADG